MPRYIIRTILGEVDFGLSSRIDGAGETLSVTLGCYDLAYYQSLAPGFEWPAGVTEDAHGRPTLPVVGLRKMTDFALS